MKVLHEIYEFVTGGSLASPIGLVVAVTVAAFCVQRGWTVAAGGALLGTLLLTLAAATAERAR